MASTLTKPTRRGWLLSSLVTLCLGCGSLIGPHGSRGDDADHGGIEAPVQRTLATQSFPGGAVGVELWFSAGPVNLSGSRLGRSFLKQLRCHGEGLITVSQRLGATTELVTEPSAVVLSVRAPLDTLDSILRCLSAIRLPDATELTEANRASPTRERLNRLMNLAYHGSAMGLGFANARLPRGQVSALQDAFSLSRAGIAIVGPARHLNSIRGRVKSALGEGRRQGFKGEVGAKSSVGPRVLVERGGGAEASISFAIPVLLPSAASAAKVDVLTRGVADWAHQRLRARGLGRVTSAFVYSPGVDSRVVLEVMTPVAALNEAWDGLADALIDLRDGQMSGTTVGRAVESVRGDVARVDGTLGGRARRLGALTHRFGGGPDVWTDYQTALSEMGNSRGKAPGLALEGLSALVVIPASVSGDPALHGEGLTERLRRRIGAPQLASSPDGNELSDGTRFMVVSRPGTGSVALQLRLAGGLSEEAESLYGAAAMAAQLVSAAAPSAKVRVDVDGLYIDWLGSPRTLRDALERIAGALTQTSWSPQTFERARRRLLASEGWSRTSPRVIGLAPGGPSTALSPERHRAAINRMTPASLGGWFQANVSDAPLTASLAGEIEAAQGARLLRSALLRPSRRPSLHLSKTANVEATDAPSQPGVWPLNTLTLSPVERETLRVVVALVERQQSGVSAGQFRFGRRHGVDFLWVSEAVLERVKRTLASLRSSAIQADALDAAKRQVIGERRVGLADNAFFAAWQVEQLVVTSDWVGPRAVSRWLAAVEGITSDDVKGLLEKLFTLETVRTTVEPIERAPSGEGT